MPADRPLIAEEMVKVAQDYFFEEHLREIVRSFIEAKTQENLAFGQLTVLHFRMLGGSSPEIWKAAAAVELMILALDILDDLQDLDNNSKPWNFHPPSISMNAATGLLVSSSVLLNQTAFPSAKRTNAIQYLNSLVLQAVNGQHTDLSNRIHAEADYIQMVTHKSAALLACACLAGTALATEDQQIHLHVKEYAEQIGIAAQIHNDIQDLCRRDEKSDVKMKKKTLPILYLLGSHHPELQPIKDYYDGKRESLDLAPEPFERIIRRSGAVEYASVIRRIHQLKAEELIGKLQVSDKWKEKLLAFV